MRKGFALWLAVWITFLPHLAWASQSDVKVGVSLPTTQLQRWTRDAEYLSRSLDTLGYAVCLTYAEDDSATQNEQIIQMIEDGAEALIIAPVDVYALSGAVATAQSAGVPVISYDRLIMNEDWISYYVTFDNYHVGALQAGYIADSLGLSSDPGPFSLELLGGPGDDNNSLTYYQGAMDVLTPYLNSGALIIRSGQTASPDVAVPGWSMQAANERMSELLVAHYQTEILDAVLAANDALALGAIDALRTAGYDLNNFPIITGQDCDIENVRQIAGGLQAMSVFKDTRTLAQIAAGIADALLTGGEMTVSIENTYSNGAAEIPTVLCDPYYADIENYQAVLIDSGYYTSEQLQ